MSDRDEASKSVSVSCGTCGHPRADHFSGAVETYCCDGCDRFTDTATGERELIPIPTPVRYDEADANMLDADGCIIACFERPHVSGDSVVIADGARYIAEAVNSYARLRTENEELKRAGKELYVYTVDGILYTRTEIAKAIAERDELSAQLTDLTAKLQSVESERDRQKADSLRWRNAVIRINEGWKNWFLSMQGQVIPKQGPIPRFPMIDTEAESELSNELSALRRVSDGATSLTFLNGGATLMANDYWEAYRIVNGQTEWSDSLTLPEAVDWVMGAKDGTEPQKG